MEKDEIKDIIIKKLKIILENSNIEDISYEQELYTSDVLSSLSYVRLLALLEEEYDIEFDEDMLIFTKGITIEKIADCICHILDSEKR